MSPGVIQFRFRCLSYCTRMCACVFITRQMAQKYDFMLLSHMWSHLLEIMWGITPGVHVWPVFSLQLRMQEIQMEAILKECIVYFFFVITTFFLSYETRDSSSYIFAQNIKDTFKYTSPAFDSVGFVNRTWWPWMSMCSQFWLTLSIFAWLNTTSWYNAIYWACDYLF